MTRLFHVSDLHFGRVDQQAIDWFAAAVTEERPDAVICTGDLTQTAKKSEFEAACRYLEGLPVPITVEPGNHDLPWNPFTRLLMPYARFGRLERLIERPLDIEHVVVVPLKTTARFQLRTNWSWGVVSPRSLSQALALLESAPATHVKLVACHHPLVDRGDLHVGGRTIRGREAMEALATAGADAVLSGHVHTPFDYPVEVGGRTIRKIGAGTLSERIREAPASFNQIDVGPGGTISVIARQMPQ